MKTVLILGGKSRRFWPLSEKPLFPVCGKTLVEHQVERLKDAGLTDLILVTSKDNRHQISERFPKATLIVQDDKIGMHHAVLAALPLCKNDAVLIVSGNDFIEPSAYKALKAEALKKNVDGALLAYKVKEYFPRRGYLSVQSGRITGIVEKPKKGKEPSDLVNIVAHIHNDASVLLKALKQIKDADDGYEQALDLSLADHHYRAVTYSGAWQAVKYPWHLLHLLPLLLSAVKKPSIHKTAKIHKTAVIEGNVIIGKNTRVLAHATIVGPCVIGDDCIIGNNALVRGSSIGNECVVGYSTEVKGSILAGPVWTHMTYLGDSIIGRNVSFGGGCMTGNLRLDEGEISSKSGEENIPTGLTKFGAIVGDDCRFGIQIGTNPGVKVGSGTFVSGKLLLTTDVPDGSFVLEKDGKLEIRRNRSAPPSMGKRVQPRF